MTLVEEVLPSAEMQSVYSSVQANRVNLGIKVLYIFYEHIVISVTKNPINIS